MFGKPQTAVVKENSEEIRELRSNHRIEILEITKSHELALKEKEFELKHFKDDEIASVRAKLAEVEQANAVLKKENEMLEKITNLNADIIDIKSLVSNLIDKLPTINLSSLTLNGSKSE